MIAITSNRGNDLDKKIVIVGVFLILLFTLFTPISLGYNVKTADKIVLSFLSFNRSNTLYVGGNGPNNYTKIQDAINDAMAGDMIFVFDYSSPYYERLVIDKSISLIGEDRNTTVIDANNYGIVIDIKVDNVIITGFTLINCGKSYSSWDDNVIRVVGCENVVIKDNRISIGIADKGNWVAGILFIGSSNNLIQNNIIFRGEKKIRTSGIEIDYESSYNNVSGNEIYGYNKGIATNGASYNMFYDNYIYNNEWGMQLYGDGNTIINNKISYNSYKGIDLVGWDSIVSENTVTYNGGSGTFCSGIHILGSSSHSITNNHISNNKYVGIWVVGPSINNIISDNDISNNDQIGIYFDDFVYHNIVSRNNLINNGRNAYFIGEFLFSFTNKWSENYWSDTIVHGLFPKIIYGEVYFLLLFPFKFINFDWHPAKEPYEI